MRAEPTHAALKQTTFTKPVTHRSPAFAATHQNVTDTLSFIGIIAKQREPTSPHGSEKSTLPNLVATDTDRDSLTNVFSRKLPEQNPCGIRQHNQNLLELLIDSNLNVHYLVYIKS